MVEILGNTEKENKEKAHIVLQPNDHNCKKSVFFLIHFYTHMPTFNF